MHTNTTIINKIFILLFILMIITPLVIPKKTIGAQELEEELDLIRSEKERTQERLDEIKKKEADYFKQVKEVEENLISSLSELEELNLKLAKAKSSIDEITIEIMVNEEELIVTEQELQDMTGALNNRVIAIYKSGSKNYLDLLIGSRDFIDFFSKLKLMNILAGKDMEMLKEIKVRRQSTLSIKNNLIDLREKEKKQRSEIEKLISQAEVKKRNIEEIYGEKQSILSSTKASKESLMELERQLSAKEAEIIKVLESYRYGSAPAGKFQWPTNGRISSGFGYRGSSLSGTRRFHSGIDLYAPLGTAVIAADSGQVILAGYEGGYGYAVLIYHGGGFATFYAHLSGFAVSPGQMVERGQLIGHIGVTGWTTGPHLHFEVRINGIAQNPLNYL
ncbi:MAG: peptidoglycan DD-metalloendopeptidase family protein [Actinobacteria bacterium]|nr:peptidoglycan DD-metalloendopeptidase family protein [Actinomycetota bacterium]